MRSRNKLNRVLAGVAVVCCAAFVGCSHSNDAERLEAFLQKPRSCVSRMEYRVLPPDVLLIKSRHVPEINGLQQRIRPDGKINFPLLGELLVAGKTPKEIEVDLAKEASEYYKLVDATVQVVAYESQRFYVFGQVRHPGPLPWTGSDTLLDVLARVQPTFIACPEKIKIVRSKRTTRGGYLRDVKVKDKKDEAIELQVNLMAMVKSGDLSHNILLQPDDVIYVPPNPFGAVGLALRQVLFPVRPVLEAARAPVSVKDIGEDLEPND